MPSPDRSAGRFVGWRAGLAFGLLLAVLVAGASASRLLQRPQWVAYHALFELRGELPISSLVRLVAIDEASLEELEAWPLPRSTYGRLLDALFAAGAVVVGIDVSFVQPAADPREDAVLAAALARHPGRVVLAANLQESVGPGGIASKLVLPTTAFRRDGIVGIANVPVDVDGSVHAFPRARVGTDPDAVGGTGAFESFDFALARRFAGLPATWRAGEEEWLIDFAGPPGHVPTSSLVSVLEAAKRGDRRMLDPFNGKVVLIGAVATRFQDLYPTPYSATVLGGGNATRMPGVEIHAHAIDTLLRDAPIHRVPEWLDLALILALGAGAGAAFIALPPGWAFVALSVAVTVQTGLSTALFSLYRLWLDPIAPFLLLAIAFITGVGAQYLRAETHRRLTRRTFERYVAKEIVDVVLEKPWLAPKLGGERREVTVLFSDIRSFTTISEQRTPEEVVAFLNAYLTAMAEVIRAERGCIDKYIGDAILALWGNVVPMTPVESARGAVRTGLKMLERLAAERENWAAAGYPPLAIGIGINTGEAVVGNIGSPEKLEFGVIGDAVNVASRIEGLTKEYGELLVSGRTRELLGEGFTTTFMASVKVKGRAQPVDIYRVDGEGGASAG